MGIVTIFTKGGFLVYCILLCSIFALSSFIERLITLHNYKIDCDDFLEKIERFVRHDNIKQALTLCRESNSPIARIVQTGLTHMGTSREKMTVLLEEAALQEFPHLESKLGIIATVAHISPLLGLLGTVNGMIRAFQVIYEKSQTTGLASPADLAQGIWTALITTALGLAVAIPSVVAYNYLFHRVQKIKHDMEKAATKVLTFIL
ncbi:MAG: MotA/TolQ/ExbB proton channel family protein [Candidatus Omnitrophica bacterium]|nr:MotA/TolQ/ExbB proton channel family protein [Candidatus Omnitrophota bacterium]